MLASHTAPTRGTFNGVALRSRAFAPARMQRGNLQVTNAITRQRKEETVANLKEKMEGSVIVFGMRFKNLDVGTVQKFRKGLPENASVVVCKNTLIRVAAKDNAKFAKLADDGAVKGENAWVFVPEDAIQDTVKHYFKFSDDLLIEAKKVAPKNTEVKPPTELSSIVMDNAVIDTKQLKACEKLPTKKQLLATIAMLAKQPTTKIATSIKQVPTKLAIAIKKVSELDEDKTKTVASVVKA